MTSNAFGRVFLAFHLILGATLLVLSVLSLHSTLRGSTPSVHVLLVAGVEALGAVLFLVPRTVRIGAALLALTLLVALFLHAARAQFRGDLLVYLAGVVLVASRATRGGFEPREPPSAGVAT
jgi:uncharacterized membrane protein YphA (DoxX/SURF4 family)